MTLPAPPRATRMLVSAGMAILIASASLAANAAQKKVTLAIPTMDCPVCPLTVKRALFKVPGVSQVEVSFENRSAVVIFDDAKANVSALTESTKNAGYPSTILESAK